jgi:hypothetical protein
MRFFKGFKKGMKDFGENISIIINSILLTLVYIIGVGATAFFARIKKKSFLEKKISEKKSYWSNLNLSKKKLKDYYRQF